jgi:predicted peptidase
MSSSIRELDPARKSSCEGSSDSRRETQSAATRSGRRGFVLCCLLAFLSISATLANANAGQPQLRTASSHPIQYYLSLPDGWSAKKKWPVVIVIESANREFLNAASVFAQSRQRGPFILVTPLVVTNGGAGYRSVPTYHYSDVVWERIQNSGPFNFDMDGITAIMQDVVKQYGGEDRYFVTGFEAGGHTVWAILFNHPELARGAALVVPNYAGRWVDEDHISTNANRAGLPIRIFLSGNDSAASSASPIYSQVERAMRLADALGYRNVSQTHIEGKGHEPLADEVLAYFSSLLPH